MDKRRGSKPVMMGCLLVVMMMMIVGGKCTPLSEFERCYAGSFIVCIIVPTNTAYACSLKSLKNCIPSPPLPPIQQETLVVAKGSDSVMKMETNYFCRLGCASSLCTNISTKHNPGGMKVANCVASCSEKCSHT